MGYLDEIAAFLAAAPVSLGVLTETLFTDRMPDTPDACVVLRGSAGAGPRRGFGVEGAQYEFPGLQVIARGVPHDSDGPRQKATRAYQALMKLQPDTVLGSTRYLMFRALGQVFQLPYEAKATDPKDRFMFACDFIVEKEPEAAA